MLMDAQVDEQTRYPALPRHHTNQTLPTTAPTPSSSPVLPQTHHSHLFGDRHSSCERLRQTEHLSRPDNSPETGRWRHRPRALPRSFHAGVAEHAVPHNPLSASSWKPALFMHDNKTNHILPQGERKKKKEANNDKSLRPKLVKLGSKRLIRCWHTKHRLCSGVVCRSGGHSQLSSDSACGPAVATPFASIGFNVLHRCQGGFYDFGR